MRTVAALLLPLLAAGACGPLTRGQRLADQDRAIARATAAIAAAPDDLARGRAYSERGRAYSEKARYRRLFRLIGPEEHARLFAAAIADHDRAIALAPADAQVFLDRGLTNHDRATVEDPGSPAADPFLAAAAADLGSAIDRNDTSIQALDMRGVVHENRADHDAAIADFRRLVDLDPRLGNLRLQDALCRRGTARMMARHADAAIADFEAAIALRAPVDACECQPESPLVSLYLEQGRHGKAWEVVREALARGRPVAPEIVQELERASARP